MLGWFQALLPREERFFELFEQHSRTVERGAEAMRAMLNGGNTISENFQLVMDREHEADDITRETLMAVRRTFITPFDRGAIKDLITSMDNSIDQMQKTAKGIILFDVQDFTPQMKSMGDAIVECSRLVREAMPLLRSISGQANRLTEISREISQFEGRADEMHDTGLRELFLRHGRTDPMAFFIGNEVYDHLEKVVDRFDDVANAIHGIVIEHV
jgi:predicted phosphate transport protein (TIGR00153 family)